MSSAGPEFPFDRLLAQIGRAAPHPWYPADFVRETGADVQLLGRALDEMRLAGLIALTPWEKGRGQGLEVTAAGAEVLLSPRWLARLAKGQLPSPGQFRGRGVADPGDATTFSRGEAVRSALLNPVNPRVTHALLGLNIVVFLVGAAITMQGGELAWKRALYWTGAVSGFWLLHGEWWRLLTCCFVHIGVTHLVMNMYGLWVMGPSLEQLWGRTRYLCIYLVSGLAGSCAAMSLKPEAIVAGASGSLWGLMAAQLMWILLNRSHLPREMASAWVRQLGTAFIINTVISFLPGISAEAHFGGGIAGAAVAMLLHGHRFVRGPARGLCLAGVVLIPLMSLALLITAMGQTTSWQRVTRWYEAVLRHEPQGEDDERR